MPLSSEAVPYDNVESLLFDELLCISDSKFILGNWYFIALPNGRSVSDWTALCAMMQNHYGHARALYRYFSRYGFTREQAEWRRDAHDIRSARVLDRSPESWADFVVTSHLCELAFSSRLAALADGPNIDPQLARLVGKIAKETSFHQLYLEGWGRLLCDGSASEVQSVLDKRLPTLLEWWGEDDGEDIVLSAGLRDASDAVLRQRFLDELAQTYAPLRLANSALAAAGGTSWRRDIRRSGASGIPASLHELIRFKEPDLAVP